MHAIKDGFHFQGINGQHGRRLKRSAGPESGQRIVECILCLGEEQGIHRFLGRFQQGLAAFDGFFGFEILDTFGYLFLHKRFLVTSASAEHQDEKTSDYLGRHFVYWNKD